MANFVGRQIYFSDFIKLVVRSSSTFHRAELILYPTNTIMAGFDCATSNFKLAS